MRPPVPGGTGVAHALSRRRFLALAGSAAAGLAVPRAWAQPSPAPFLLGVASGDPSATGVVLWTRLARDLPGGDMGPDPVAVRWEVASDDRLRHVVRRGSATARPEAAHTVRVDVDGLAPDRWYWYRFHAAGEASPVGRTRTLPPPDALPRRLRFAFLSCQNYEAGHYSALHALAEEDLDLVVHLGDYIYEGAGRAGGVRRHAGGEARTLEGYRGRYAQYRSDPALQAVHAAFPMIATWDDHEVQNNYAGAHPPRGARAEAFLARRAAAYQAYWEHLPLGPACAPRGPDMALHRRFRLGRLADLHVLDARQYRTPQPCAGGAASRCAAALAPEATMLGPIQERWLLDGLRASTARWTLIAQQVLMAPMNFAGAVVDEEDGRYNMDAWDGYPAARARLLGFLHHARPANPVVLTGDMHSSWMNHLLADVADPRSPAVATELVCPSVTSRFPAIYNLAVRAALSSNPHVRYFDGVEHGYVRCEIGPRECRADFRYVATTAEPVAPVRTGASFVVLDGAAGAQPA